MDSRQSNFCDSYSISVGGLCNVLIMCALCLEVEFHTAQLDLSLAEDDFELLSHPSVASQELRLQVWTLCLILCCILKNLVLLLY